MSILATTSTLGTTLDHLVLPPFPVHRFTVEEYFALTAAGVIGEDDNVELLEGWIVPKMTKKPLHDFTVDRLLRLLVRLIPDQWYLRVQNVLQTSTSAPEPDFVLIGGEQERFRERHPTGIDALLVIEVADSSLAIDRRKATIYAAAGVPRYWIVNLPDQCVEVYEALQERDGAVRYAEPRIVRGNEDLMIVLDDNTSARLNCKQIFG